MGRWRIAVWVALVAALLAFLYAVRGILLPFLLAWLIAVLLEPVVRKLRLRGMSRGLAVTSITLAFFVVAGVATIAVAPSVNAQLGEMQRALQSLTNRLAEENASENVFLGWNPAVKAQPPGPVGWIDRTIEDAAPMLESVGLPGSRRAIIDQYVEPRRDELASIVKNFFNGFLGIIGGAMSQVFLLLFTPLFVFMILLDLERFRAKWTSWVPPAIRPGAVSIVADIGDVFKKYLRGVLITVAAYMVVMSVVFGALAMPYSILLAMIAGALYLIPMLGPLMSALTIFVVTGLSGQTGNWFMTAGSPWVFAAVLVVVFLAVSTVFDQLVYPRMVGKAVDLHPLVSMFVIFSGGALFGLPGMLIAFPLAGSIKVVLARLLRLTTKPATEDLGLPATPARHRHTAEA